MIQYDTVDLAPCSLAHNIHFHYLPLIPNLIDVIVPICSHLFPIVRTAFFIFFTVSQGQVRPEARSAPSGYTIGIGTPKMSNQGRFPGKVHAQVRVRNQTDTEAK